MAPMNIYIEYGSLKLTSDIAQKVKKYGKLPITVTAHSTNEILYLGENATFVVVRLRKIIVCSQETKFFT